LDCQNSIREPKEARQSAAFPTLSASSIAPLLPQQAIAAGKKGVESFPRLSSSTFVSIGRRTRYKNHIMSFLDYGFSRFSFPKHQFCVTATIVEIQLDTFAEHNCFRSNCFRSNCFSNKI
jgi:hypothetical protein